MRRSTMPPGRASLAAAVLALGLVVVALAGGATAGAGTAAAGDVLTIDNVYNNKGLDPHTELSLTAYMADRAMYDTLLTFKGSGTKPVPSLATSWKASADGRTFTFPLRRGAVFSDGTPVTSADVVFSFRRMAGLKVSSFLIDGVTASAQGPYTVVLRSKTSNPALPRIVTSPALSIVNAAVVRAHGGSAAPNAYKVDKAGLWLSHNSAGSGPYILNSFTAQEQIVLETNPAFRGAKPHFKKIVIRNMGTPAQLLNVQRGSNEVAYDLSAVQAASLKSKQGLSVLLTPAPILFFLDLNRAAAGCDACANPHIQRAIRYALDYAALLQVAGPGAVQAPGLVPPQFLGHLPPAAAPKRNLDKARAEIAASGIAHPAIQLEADAGITFAGVSLQLVGERAQAALKEAGFDVKLVTLSYTVSNPLHAAGKLQLQVNLTIPDYLDPNAYLIFIPGSRYEKSNGWPASADPQLAALGEQAGATLDDTKRARLFQQIQLRLNRVGPFYQLFFPVQSVVATSGLTNVAYNPMWGLDVAAIGSR